MAESRIPAPPLRGRCFPSAAGLLLALALFAGHAALRSAALADIERGKEGRSWEDLSLAISYALHGEFPVAAYEVRTDFFPREDPAFVAFRADLREETAAARIPPWRFWRTIPATRFADRGPRYLALISDDAGRALLLGGSFRLLRGIAPFLLSWLAVLVSFPVLAWAGLELRRAGRPVAGAVFVGSVAFSPYVIEALELPYSAAGFYLAGALALAAFAVYGALGRSSSAAGFAARLAAAGAVIALTAACRRGVLFLVPAFLMAAACALGRVMAGAARARRAGAIVLAGAALLAPYAGAAMLVDRLAQKTARSYGTSAITLRHSPWFSLWEGLGDFDRSKGYEWRDAAARRFVNEEGAGRLLSPRSERLFRARILRDVREDPLWYVSILVKRALATVTQWKLRPWGPTAGVSVAPAASPNEGLVDAYYRLTATADWIGIADRRVEVPLPLFWLPALGLTAVRWTARTARRPDGEATRAGGLRALGILAAGLLTLPVLVSTASAIETQAFLLVYLLAFALLAQEAVERACC